MLHASLPRLSGANLCKAHVPLCRVIDILERHLWDESLGLPRLVNHAVEFVDLFERETFGFVDHKPATRMSQLCVVRKVVLENLHKRDANEAKRSPDEEDFALQICAFLINHIRCRISNSPIQKPVTRRRHGEALRTSFQWEKFTGDYPGDWSPRTGEEEDVYAYKGDGCTLSRKIGGASHSAGDGYDV
jgi:hypothetical protein